MMTRRLRILVAEDEDLARARLARLIGERADLELVAVCRNGHEAQAALAAGDIDIALLDIQMPGSGGIELLRKVGAIGVAPPLIVFITAHPRFAVDAFAGEAVDYVLKPFDAERLDKALRVARARVHARDALAINERIRAAIDSDADAAAASATGDSAVSGRLLVRENGCLHSLRDEQIDWIEADGRYCIVHCADKRHRIAGPLCELAGRLHHDRFAAVSRSALINIERIGQLQEMFKENLLVVLKTGAEVPVSRRFRAGLLQRLGAPRN